MDEIALFGETRNDRPEKQTVSRSRQNTKKLKSILNRKYPISIYFLEEDKGKGYYFAFLPDFGHSACSATGETIQEALDSLEIIKKIIIKHYFITNKKIPIPSTIK